MYIKHTQNKNIHGHIHQRHPYIKRINQVVYMSVYKTYKYE